MKKLILLAIVCLSACSTNDLKPFTTDGCSSFPDGTMQQQTLWLNCCIKHDLSYWKGGTYEERLAADLALEQCVANIGESNVAKIMLAGVRVGGSPYWPTPYRWGYGWPYLRGYSKLTAVEKQQIQQKLIDLELMLRSLQHELQLPETDSE